MGGDDWAVREWKEEEKEVEAGAEERRHIRKAGRCCCHLSQ